MTAPPSRQSRTLLGIVAMLVFGIFRRLLGLISLASLTRLLSPADVGAYAFTQTLGQTSVGLFRLGVMQGLHVSISRRLSAEDREDLGELLGGGFLLICAITIVGSVVVVALAEPIAHDIFGAPELTPYVTVAAVLFAGLFLSTGAYVGFAGIGQFVTYTYYATAVGIFTVAATIMGAVLWGVKGAVWAFAGATLASSAFLFAGLLRATRADNIRIRLRLRRDHVHRIFAIGLPFYGAGLFMIPADFLSQGMVSRFGSVEDLADLRIILALMAVVQLIPLAISGPLISLFSEREGLQKGSGMASALEHMRWLWMFALMSGAVLAAIWPLAVLVLFGGGYPQAAAVGQIAIVAFIPIIVGTSLSAGILVGGRTLPLIGVGIVQAGIMVGSAVVLIREIGLAGFFIAQALASTGAVLLWLLVLARQTRRTVFRSWMGPLLLATVILYMVLAADLWFAKSVLERSIFSSIVVPAFCLAIFFTVMAAQERAALYRAALLLATTIRSRLARGSV